MKRLSRSPALWFFVFLAFYLAGRITAPNDLNTKDQPRTVSYTVDMLQNGRWTCPVDMMGQPATKPPLYNWVSALPIAATGIYHTLTFKLPSLLAGLGCLFFLALFARHLESLNLAVPIPFSPVFWFSSLIWLANFTVYGLIYTARPDMVLAFFLFAGWTISTLLLEQSPVVQRHAPIWCFALWLFLQAAILTKGTPALLLILYIPIYSLFRFRTLRPVFRTQFLIGFPVVALLSYLWFSYTWQHLPQGHKDLLVNMESSRILKGGPLESLKGFYKMPHYFLVRFVPWSLVFLWFLVQLRRGKIAATPWTSVWSWFLLVLVFFSIPVFKRDDYLLPIYPVCALAGGYAMWTFPSLARNALAALALALMAGSVVNDFRFKKDLMPRFADNSDRFAQVVRKTVPAKAKLVFFKTGYNNLQAFLGRNSPLSEAKPDALQPGDYLLQPAYLLNEKQARDHRIHGPDFEHYQAVSPAPELKLEQLHLSAPLYNVSGAKPGIVGLYRVLGKPQKP